VEKEESMKENDRIKVYLHGTDKNSFWYREPEEIFTVYKKNGKLGIDWNKSRSIYTCKGDIFCPFYTFANTVIFENVDTGKRYYWDDISDSLKETD